ncbi:MAG: alkaline phosphatase family protein [Clostridia bacterium]|nr:alkaline phosphatase family protein [Clostridia bacterium]
MENKNGFTRIIMPILSIVLIALILTFSVLNEFIFSRFSRGVVPTDSQLAALKESGGVYDHVVIFGVDGAGAYFDKIDSPGFDSVFKNKELDASVTYKALAQLPSNSGQNWGSMFHGTNTRKLNVDNEIVSTRKYADTTYPSLFKVYAERHPEAKMVSVCDWFAINLGIIEDIEQVTKIDGSDIVGSYDNPNGYEGEERVDEVVALEAINQIKTNDPTIVFMHFDCVDGAGHAYGTGSTQYDAAMKHVDGLIGMVYNACVENGWRDNTLFMCVADHGHEYRGGHGSNHDIVKYVTFAVAGGKGNVINGSPEYVVTHDLAPVVFYALGEKQYETWDGSVPKNMFKGL